MIGAFMASAAAHATGVIGVKLPDVVTLPSFVALGAIVGTRFSGLKPRDILALLKPTVASFLAVTALARLLLRRRLGAQSSGRAGLRRLRARRARGHDADRLSARP
ncbi:AbrB family transcriptional regulator [Chenggangzhangella methanolivorans]|uniref:Uncharacterized protein n=1 Tax=Chenggangzhangella methanolivorans TaxID=1437009 RepID=A0A9E6UJS5_9HYPH|nr:AbrB family transcriptional regulator [Chenggangzhangella methanolivorans]QZN98441.1 hypothetical protein K6K41_15315 [Chenggangzhangella methanolivorans]